MSSRYLRKLRGQLSACINSIDREEAEKLREESECARIRQLADILISIDEEKQRLERMGQQSDMFANSNESFAAFMGNPLQKRML